MPNHFVYVEPNANQAFREGEEQRESQMTKLNSVTYDKGIFLNFEGAEFPQKGMVPEDSQDIIRSINIIKAVFIEVFKIRPSIKSLVASFNRIAGRVMKPYILKNEFKSANTREISNILYSFLYKLTGDAQISRDFGEYFSHILEYDNAYRLRFVDICSEANREMLIAHPRLEIARLLRVVIDREGYGTDVARKFGYVEKLLITLLFIPKYRRAFTSAIAKADWEKLIYDDIDRYWACLRTDYKFMGMDSDTRLALLKELNFSIPTLTKTKV